LNLDRCTRDGYSCVKPKDDPTDDTTDVKPVDPVPERLPVGEYIKYDNLCATVGDEVTSLTPFPVGNLNLETC